MRLIRFLCCGYFLTSPSLCATFPIWLLHTGEECEILVDGIRRELIKLYKNEREAKNLLPFRVIELGFEPKTHSLEGCCSIQLSYRTILMFRLEGCPFAKNRSANIGIFYLMAMFPGESFCKFYMPDTQESETGGVREMYICLF